MRGRQGSLSFSRHGGPFVVGEDAPACAGNGTGSVKIMGSEALKMKGDYASLAVPVRHGSRSLVFCNVNTKVWSQLHVQRFPWYTSPVKIPRGCGPRRQVHRGALHDFLGKSVSLTITTATYTCSRISTCCFTKLGEETLCHSLDAVRSFVVLPIRFWEDRAARQSRCLRTDLSEYLRCASINLWKEAT